METIRYSMLVRKRIQTRLTPHDWAKAALEAIARGGIDAVAVEPIAAELGSTKGSFYWHFKNRDSLIKAALELWEERRTDAVIRQLEHHAHPADRLRILMEAGLTLGPTDRVEIALLANPGHPAARRTVRRVSERRIAYLSAQFEALGWAPVEARDRAVLMAYVYVGNIQVAHFAPNVVDADARKRQVDLVFNALVADAPFRSAAPKT